MEIGVEDGKQMMEQIHVEPHLIPRVPKKHVQDRLTHYANHFTRPMLTNEYCRRDIPQVTLPAVVRDYPRNDAPFASLQATGLSGKLQAQDPFGGKSKYQVAKPFPGLVPKKFLSVHY